MDRWVAGDVIRTELGYKFVVVEGKPDIDGFILLKDQNGRYMLVRADFSGLYPVEEKRRAA